jgi:isoleucyl-tRNA synthetase
VFRDSVDRSDPDALELAVLELWNREHVFDRLREQNSGGETFSFLDGPVTANKTLGVHTAWGRTLKDAFQRYKALRGFHQRYQNGFDAQGLWIEVGVEKQLGFDSKREIEEYGLAEFAARCREVVEWSVRELTAGSIRLGQWMDWGNDYVTSSDTNIEYIWHFLQVVHDRGWLSRGFRATEWCPRCGTSISAHELAGSYTDREDTTATVRLPLLERPGEALVIWTTTPWTLPANVAVAVHPERTYARNAAGEWLAAAQLPEDQRTATVTGAELVDLRYRGPFDDLEPGSAVDHKVIAWDEVDEDEGTGLVHIAPGCGVEDFELGQRLGLDALAPVDEAGHYLPEYGWLAGRYVRDATPEIIARLEAAGTLKASVPINHRYPECWRCHTPLIYRLAQDWFIGVDGVRQQMRDANDGIEWTPEYMGRRMDDWLVNMADWNISRRRYYGMPLPFYPCSCGQVTVIGSKRELLDRAVAPVTGLEQLRRPYLDDIAIACGACGKPVHRIDEVGDVWLDAGIVPFSTMGWHRETAVPGGGGTGAAQGITTADLPDHAYWEQWFPADWASEMREQIRLWFYATLFMSVVLTGQAPYRKILGYEKMLAQDGREMHGSWGNMIAAEDAFRDFGADVMRWLFCAQPPGQNLLFGPEPAREVERRLLTFWNTVNFFLQYASLARFVPGDEPLAGPPADTTAGQLDRWLIERRAQLVRDATAGFETYLSGNALKAVDDYVEDLSNWYVRLSRRRFWDGEPAALDALWRALVDVVRVLAPVTPFLSEHLWGALVSDVQPQAKDSVFLAGWPEERSVDTPLLEDMALVRRVVELGRAARGRAKVRGRQPLRQLVVEGGDRVAGYAGLVAAELRVGTVVFAAIPDSTLRVRPNLRVLGRTLGARVADVRKALSDNDFVLHDDGTVAVLDLVLQPEEVLIDRVEREGWAVTSEHGLSVALDLTLDDALLLEGRVNDAVTDVNGLRKATGLAISDRIVLRLPAQAADLLPYADRFRAECLATSVSLGRSENYELSPVELAADDS